MDEARKAQLDAELAEHNKAVAIVLGSRKAWMDAHMADYARFQIGDEIYDLTTGSKLGTVTEHYRYWASDPRFDDNMSIYYRYKTYQPFGGYELIDNTSRQTGVMFGTKADVERYLGSRLASLRAL